MPQYLHKPLGLKRSPSLPGPRLCVPQVCPPPDGASKGLAEWGDLSAKPLLPGLSRPSQKLELDHHDAQNFKDLPLACRLSNKERTAAVVYLYHNWDPPPVIVRNRTHQYCLPTDLIIFRPGRRQALPPFSKRTD